MVRGLLADRADWTRFISELARAAEDDPSHVQVPEPVSYPVMLIAGWRGSPGAGEPANLRYEWAYVYPSDFTPSPAPVGARQSGLLDRARRKR